VHLGLDRDNLPHCESLLERAESALLPAARHGPASRKPLETGFDIFRAEGKKRTKHIYGGCPVAGQEVEYAYVLRIELRPTIPPIPANPAVPNNNYEVGESRLELRLAKDSGAAALGRMYAGMLKEPVNQFFLGAAR